MVTLLFDSEKMKTKTKKVAFQILERTKYDWLESVTLTLTLTLNCFALFDLTFTMVKAKEKDKNAICFLKKRVSRQDCWTPDKKCFWRRTNHVLWCDFRYELSFKWLKFAATSKLYLLILLYFSFWQIFELTTKVYCTLNFRKLTPK